MLPELIHTTDELEEALSRPTPVVVESLRVCQGDLIVLGAGGKMGPSLCRMARRAADEAGGRRRVIAVSRFTRPGTAEQLRAWGVETVSCDLLEPGALDCLPDAPLVVSMLGYKFGTSEHGATTWAVNVWLAGQIAQRYRNSRLVVFSTGNVYPLTPVHLGGSLETDAPSPVGEYGASALGRERIVEYFSRCHGTPVSIVRLNYAQDLRYGILSELALSVLNERPIDLTMGHFNAIWQGDANAMALASLARAATPPLVFNVAGPETLSVRQVCCEFGRLLGRTPRFIGSEAADALLSNSQLAMRLFGYPSVPIQQVIRWVAHWVRSGGESLGRATHYEVRDGRF